MSRYHDLIKVLGNALTILVQLDANDVDGATSCADGLNAAYASSSLADATCISEALYVDDGERGVQVCRWCLAFV